jgi:BON domain
MSVRRFHGVGMAFLAASLMSGGVAVSAQSNPGQGSSTTLPDAQIESNVLRALASAPELSSQNIQTSTVYGTVTLTGNVQDEAMRTKAENLAARAQGVQKVVDELVLGDTPPAGQNMQNGAPPPDEQQMQGQGAPPPEGYAGQQGPPNGRQPMDQSYGPQANGAAIPGGQQAGIPVTVPPGSILRIRINRGLDSNHIEAGAAFDGTVLTDIVAGGQVAIPRGATVSGQVVGAKKAGTFKGQGQLALQIDSLTLGGQVYPLQTEVWAATGQDKTGSTVGSTVGTSAFGAIIGGIVGGGAGAAIGAGAGAGVGLAGSAATPRGQVIIPPESVLTFRTAAPATVQTVSEREMQRLSYQAGPPQPNGPPQVRYYSPYYGYYYGPPR